MSALCRLTKDGLKGSAGTSKGENLSMSAVYDSPIFLSLPLFESLPLHFQYLSWLRPLSRLTSLDEYCHSLPRLIGETRS